MKSLIKATWSGSWLESHYFSISGMYCTQFHVSPDINFYWSACGAN